MGAPGRALAHAGQARDVPSISSRGRGGWCLLLAVYARFTLRVRFVYASCTLCVRGVYAPFTSGSVWCTRCLRAVYIRVRSVYIKVRSVYIRVTTGQQTTSKPPPTATAITKQTNPRTLAAQPRQGTRAHGQASRLLSGIGWLGAWSSARPAAPCVLERRSGENVGRPAC